jgi:hypothetical protein
MKGTKLIAALIALAAGMALSTSTAYAQGQLYEVTITNLTRGQIISPPVVATHNRAFELFTPGEAASSGLAQLAEDAQVDALTDMLAADSRVFDFSVGNDVILPGGSLTVEVRAGAGFRTFTAVGMLVTTNDAFFAARGKVGTALFEGDVWDAGSEANTQRCSDIPGPPCGNAGVRVTNGAEGYVHIHSGIHRFGNLRPRNLDWRNPGVSVSVRRVG